MTPSPSIPSAEASSEGEEPYGDGFSSIYASNRYGVFSKRLAKLALKLIEQRGAPGRDLLDLACGAAAGSLVFAGAGFRVSGIDRSATMLRLAERAAAEAGTAIVLSRQDMQSFSLDYQVDVVTCLFDALNYVLDEDELQQVFRCVAAVLRPRGLFVFDMNTVHGLAIRWGTRDVVSTTRADLYEVNRYRFDAECSINTVTTTIFIGQGEGGLFRRYSETHRERGYSMETIGRLAAAASLDIVSCYGLMEQFQGLASGLQALTDDAGRMMVVARRGIS